MNIANLKTFLTVVELGNLNKAAERLNVTQSTVSARLDALEEALGQNLLARSRRGAQMTKAGFSLQRHAEVIVQAWDLGRRAVDIPVPFDGMFSVSCEQDLWEGVTELWVNEIKLKQPALAIEVWPGAVSEISAWLRSGLIDAAVTRDPISDDGVATRALRQEEIIFVRYSGSSNGDITVAVDHGPDFRRQQVNQDQTAAFTFGVGGSRWALDHILNRQGSGYLARSLVAPYLASGDLLHVAEKPAYWLDCHLSWRATSVEQYPWLDANIVLDSQ